MDNPPNTESSAAILDEAPKTTAPDRSCDRFQLVRATLPNLLHTMIGYTSPASRHLDDAMKAFAETHGTPNDVTVKSVPHFATVREWCEANPADAARIVLCAVYLANGRYVAQEEVAPADAEAQPPDAAQTNATQDDGS